MAAQAPLQAHPKGATISLPPGFEIHGVTSKLLAKPPSTTSAPPLPTTSAPPLPTTSAPPLLVLNNFQGTFVGNGFNTIFRPQSSATPTTFPNNATQGPKDNVLELNLTAETLAFGSALGSVPNRGLSAQGDIFLSGVPYVQTIQDVTNPATGKADGPATGIHFEPGLWMHVPASTTNPVQVESLNRMASIPHGTTINAQSVVPTATTLNAPNIPRTDITPFSIKGDSPFRFPSQKAESRDTLRLPQDLSTFITAKTITQDILDDPNTVLRNANKGKSIKNTTTIQVSTKPKDPKLSGGTANIDFLVGANTGSPNGPNAQAVEMDATFWISEVSHEITVPVHTLGQGPLEIAAPSPVAGERPGFQAPSFIIDPQFAITAAKTITVTSTQIQYSQKVILNFGKLSWPHVSVATLIPKDPITVPNTVLSQ